MKTRNKILINKSLRPVQKNKLGKKRYEELKKEFEKQKDNDILQKFKILNEAYDLLKKSHLKMRDYGMSDLASDFDVSLETVKRILSLRKANKRNWNLMVKGKISAYKLAYALSRKNIELQDEVVDIIIKNNLSSRKIHLLRTDSLDQLRKSNNEKFLIEGYKDKQNAFTSFKLAFERINLMVNMDIDNFFESKHEEMGEIVKKTIDRLNNWIKIHDRKIAKTM